MTDKSDNQARKSSYPMLSVEQALAMVMERSAPTQTELVPIMDSCGRVVSDVILSNDPFPAFACSIMDGYAVHAPLAAGVYDVQERVHAGDPRTGLALEPGKVTYITTGAMLPTGANAVIKVEDTEAVEGGNVTNEKRVHIKVSVDEGDSVRQIGSDIAAKEVIMKPGESIQPAEVGLLATAGVSMVPVYRTPLVGVMSTGDELVDPWETPTGSQIRDSNRAAMMASFRQDGYQCVDLGIVRDAANALEAKLLDAIDRCDIVVTSGGVSMGAADLVKPMLAKLGTVHFGRLNMKPGKPTTFATVRRQRDNRDVMLFGLPGNPASCLVTKALFIDPCLNKLRGKPDDELKHPSVLVNIENDMKLDKERPEYHRAIVSVPPSPSSGGLPLARSTGGQRSSRIMSMKSANALVLLPAGEGAIQAKDSALEAMLVSPARYGTFSSAAVSIHKAAKGGKTSSPSNGTPCGGPKDDVPSAGAVMRVGILTVSDRASTGEYADKSGPELARLLAELNEENTFKEAGAGAKIAHGAPIPSPYLNLQARVVDTRICPDDKEEIAKHICAWTDHDMVDLVLTTGGTGFGPRDQTPEAIRPLLHREAPGVAQALLAEGLRHTPLAVLSRPVCGTRWSALICTFPGSVKACKENFTALKPLLPRIMELTQSGQCSHKNN